MLAGPSRHRQNDVDRLGPAPPPPHQLPNGLTTASTSPPAYSHTHAHSAASIRFPDVPTTDLVLPPPNQSRLLSHNGHDVNSSTNTLPPLSSVTGQSLPFRGDAMMNQSAPPLHQWPSLNPISPYHVSPGLSQPAHRIDSPTAMDLNASSNSVASAASPDRHMDGRASSVNLDDPDVRLAAEALGDLRAGK